jgi:hypothetical protein
MSWSNGLGWAAFLFMALAIAAGGYAKTDFHSVQAVLAASVAVFTGLAGLCLHPPWAGMTPSAPPAPEPKSPVSGAVPPVQAGGRL